MLSSMNSCFFFVALIFKFLTTIFYNLWFGAKTISQMLSTIAFGYYYFKFGHTAGFIRYYLPKLGALILYWLLRGFLLFKNHIFLKVGFLRLLAVSHLLFHLKSLVLEICQYPKFTLSRAVVVNPHCFITLHRKMLPLNGYLSME